MLTQPMTISNPPVVIKLPTTLFAAFSLRIAKLGSALAKFMFPDSSDISLEQWQQLEYRRSYPYPCKISEHMSDLRHL